MEKLKSLVFLVIVVGIIGFVGYWSVTTIQSGSEHVINQKTKQLEEENEDLKKEIENLTYELSVLQSKVDEFELDAEEAKTATTPVVYKYQELVDKLQKLVNDGIFMKLKSHGTRVGTLQKFLNIYNNTSNKVDNDYGPATRRAIIAFQKAQKITADGEAGPNTFKKMISWLKTQN